MLVLWDNPNIPKVFCWKVSYLHCAIVSLLHHNNLDTRTHRLAPGSHFRLERSSSLDGWRLLFHFRERITIRHGELAVARVCSAQRSAQAVLVGFGGFLFAARPASWRQPYGLQHEYCLGTVGVRFMRLKVSTPKDQAWTPRHHRAQPAADGMVAQHYL